LQLKNKEEKREMHIGHIFLYARIGLNLRSLAMERYLKIITPIFLPSFNFRNLKRRVVAKTI
jgi:hypothetical protein